MGHLDTKFLPKLVQDLETLRLNCGTLLSRDASALDIGMLLGKDMAAERAKTRLSILSLKFLGDSAEIDFWVSRLLVEISRWGDGHPRESLQAVFLFDEADLYLPAMGQPATKEPMENLLRRARSAGTGIFLATQSPVIWIINVVTTSAHGSWARLPRTQPSRKCSHCSTTARKTYPRNFRDKRQGNFCSCTTGRSLRSLLTAR